MNALSPRFWFTIFVAALICHPVHAQDRGLALIDAMPPWTSYGTSYNWPEALRIAREFQSLKKDEIKSAFKAWPEHNQVNFKDGYEEDSKPFLLLLIMFEVPEGDPPQKIENFKGWTTNNANQNADGMINLAWPTSWRTGSPQLLSEYRGSQGPHYNPLHQYNYFQKHFKHRSLPVEKKDQ